MRIIGGKLKGIRLHPPTQLPSRPTTDRSKEALFNILNNQIEFSEVVALDLFSGTGNIALELASRGARQVVAVDRHFKCCAFIKETAQKYDLNIQVHKAAVLSYLKRSQGRFNLVFADPPFDMPEISLLPGLVFAQGMLQAGGLFILEHPSKLTLDHLPNFVKKRTYGYSAFSFFEHQIPET